MKNIAVGKFLFYPILSKENMPNELFRLSARRGLLTFAVT